jgi:hypothetical protein
MARNPQQKESHSKPQTRVDQSHMDLGSVVRPSRGRSNGELCERIQACSAAYSGPPAASWQGLSGSPSSFCPSGPPSGALGGAGHG